VGQSLASIFLHLVFSTKERQPFLREPSLEERTHGYLASILNNADEEHIPKKHDLDARSVTCIADCGCERLKKILERKL
jgi:hypothetical protein